MSEFLLAEVALEVADYYPDDDKFTDMTRAEWRFFIVQKAMQICKGMNITLETDDIDEIVAAYLTQEEALS